MFFFAPFVGKALLAFSWGALRSEISAVQAQIDAHLLDLRANWMPPQAKEKEGNTKRRDKSRVDFRVHTSVIK